MNESKEGVRGDGRDEREQREILTKIKKKS